MSDEQIGYKPGKPELKINPPKPKSPDLNINPPPAVAPDIDPTTFQREDHFVKELLDERLKNLIYKKLKDILREKSQKEERIKKRIDG